VRKIPQIDENERGIARYRATPDASRPRANDATATSVDDGSGGDEPRFQLEAPAISLPKGGGAIKGIDEKFTVNASNGTLSLSLPLPLTPARNGAAPALRLSYDTGAGNSVVGLGWSLELASVRRGTDRFIPRYDADDVFLLTGGDDLVPAMSWDGADWVPDEEPPGDLTVKRYRPRVDRDFARIEQITDGADTWWRVMSRENVTTFFGIDEHSRIVDPERPSRVYEWLPAISFDDQGNCVVYEYKPDDTAGVTATQAEANRVRGLAKSTNRHLKRIAYGNRTPYFVDPANPYVPAAPSAEFMFEAVLDYGEHDPDAPTPDDAPGRAWSPRPDPFSSHRAGFEIRTRRLLQRVLMFHRFDELNGGQPTLVRSLDLAHAPSDGGEVSYLASATQCGYAPIDGGYSKRSLPPLEFDYQPPTWNTTVRAPDHESVASLPAGAASPNQWVDLYGEGIAGVFGEQEGAWRYCANLGDVDEPGKMRLDASRLVRPKPSFTGVRSGVLTFEDLDADGRKQVVVRSPEIAGYFELEDGERWADLRPLPAVVRIDLSDRHVRMLDLVGDGRADILVSEDDALVWYRSNGSKGFGERHRTTLSSDEERSPAVVFADQTQAIMLADMTGDGLTDIVRVRNRDVSYWPNRGYGRFGARVAMNDAPVLAEPGDFDARHVRLADLTGTGATDLLYLGREGAHAYLNLSGNGFAPRREIAPALRTESPVEIATADVLGNGTTCLVWSSGLPADRESPLRYVDPMGGSKPHLLRGYSNGLGKEVEFAYTSSTWHYLKDRSEGRPWATRLPFPVHCVRRVESRDTIAGSRRVCSYRYHHGHYDHREREFRGFGMVEETDAEEFEHWGRDSAGIAVDRTVHQAPVLTKTWFHTGAELDDRGLLDVYRDERWDSEMRRNGFTANADEPELPDIRTVAAAGPELADPQPPRARREAQRACRGMPLRREVFALDSPPAGATQDDLRRQLSPYTVDAHTCLVELLQPPLDGGHAVLTVKESERITWQYDRNIADPRVEHTLNVAIDEYGNVLESAKVAYARRTPDPTLPEAATSAQARQLVTYTLTEMTGDAVGADQYRLRVASRVTDYELTGLTPPAPIFDLGDFERPGFSVLTDSTEIPNHQDNVLPPSGTVFRRMISRKETIYYDAALTAAAPLHHLEPHGLPFESYELAFPAALLTDVFGSRATAAVMVEGGYVHRGDADWWVPSGRWEYVGAGETDADARARFLAHVAQVDASGSRTTIGYFGNYFLLQDEVVDAVGNHTRATEFDLRALRPRQIQDPNDNVSEILLDELGWVKAVALLGKGGEGDDLGGLTSEAGAADDAAIAQLFTGPSSVEVAAAAALLLGDASARYVHDLDRYRASGGVLPPVTATIVREEHAAVNPIASLQVSFEYPNGGGKVEMTKIQAEPGPATSTTIALDGSVTLTTVDTAALVPPRLRWLGTGRKVVNNKGNVVKEYEPFFSATPEFETEKQLVAAGVTRIHRYDPIDRLVRVDQPDGSFSRTRYGPWSAVEEDRNDTVLESRWYDERIHRKIDVKLVAAGKDPVREAAAAAQAAEHANTPLTRHLDPLGRPVVETQHAGTDGGGQPVLFHTAYRRDLSGRTLAVTNPRGIATVAYRRDMRGALARYDSPDSGTRLTLANVMGNPLRAWDDRFHELEFTYDALHRPLTKRVRGGDGPQPLDNVFELNVYGEDRPGDKAANLRTRLALAYDTAGRTEHTAYDFKGNLLAASRRFATDYRAVVDWSGPDPDTGLDAETFDSACAYDALDRITSRTVPDGSTHTPTYNAANLLETVTVEQDGDSELVLKNIDYDEHGLRQRIVLGNDVATDYLHDAETFRLVRLTTSRGGTALQDLTHTYDPVGNLTHLVDACVPTVWFSNAMVTGESTFRYEPLYRLTEATGREHAGQAAFGPTDHSSDAANFGSYAVTDVLAWQTFTEHYQYDPAGNLQQLAHTAPATPGWTRDYTYAPDSDRLLSTTVGALTYAYGHHPKHGYIESMPHLSLMRWSFKDELQALATQVVNAGVPETTWHVYDGDGKRVRKVTDRAAPTEDAATRRFERYTVDGTEIEREYDGVGAVTAQRRSLHVMDDEERIALIETDDPPGGPPGPRLIRYQGADRLGSASLETDALGRVISYELYHPFGTTAYQAVEKTIVAAAKRFRYTGMERDAESGLEYHGARYYAPWLGRWLAPDTHADRLDGNRYAYVRNNPVANRDRNGLFEEPVHGITTFRLAVAAGFTVEDAATIAVETAAMDHDREHWPGGGASFVSQVLLGRTQEYHFPSQEKALADVDADIAGGVKDLTKFAQHLHTLEDVGFTDAAGPHNRSNTRVFGQLTGGATMAFLGAGLSVAAATGVFSGTAGTGGKVATGILLGLSALMFVTWLFVHDVGHPTYETEKGQSSTSFSHVADRASEDPAANSKELWEIYYTLRRARAARYGAAVPGDLAAASAAINDVVRAEDSAAVSNMANFQATDFRGKHMSYAEALDRRTHDGWKAKDMDVSFTSNETWRYRAPVQVRPVPVR